MKKILIVDDDIGITNYLRIFLMQTGNYLPTILNDSAEVPQMLASGEYDLLLLDMDMPRMSGMDILNFINEKQIAIATIVITGVSDVELAVNAMKLGAYDYLTKPVESDHLLKTIEGAIHQKQIRRTIAELPQDLSRDDLQNKNLFKDFLTKNKEMIRVFHLAEKMAVGDEEIFITGEAGIGKEELAKAIHLSSQRKKGKFVVLDVSTYDPMVLPVMLFGQAKDWQGVKEEHAGFIEEVDGGTLFIDNIEKMPYTTQLKFLRLIQKREFYCEGSTRVKTAQIRIIAASEYNLDWFEKTENFDKNLLCQLKINYLYLPPLRERKEDIALLTNNYLMKEIKRRKLKVKGASDNYLKVIEKYSFHGNIHELQHIIASSLDLCDGAYLLPEHLPAQVLENISHDDNHRK